MCHAAVDAKTLERETMDRLRAARPVPVAQARPEDGPPPELIGGLAGVAARLRAAFGALRAARA